MPAEMKAVAPEQLPEPKHMTGIGDSHITITTTKPEAQAWFDQGLSLLHDFWDYESAKAFEQSVRVDPQCAMCWWGLAQAEGFRGDDDAMKLVGPELEKAKKLAATATPGEQLYIKAALESYKHRDDEPRGKNNPDVMPKKHKDSSETKVLRKLVKMDPQSIQARLLLAGSVRDGFTHGEPNPGTQEEQAILAALLKEHPNDPAALHYWIHVIEPGNHPELARDAAVKLGSITPASGHMVHMPGHIFYLLGEYDEAQRSFSGSTEVDEAYMRALNVTPDDDWNYVHNLMYSIANMMEAGHFAAADELAARTLKAHGTRPATLYVSAPRDGMARLSPELPSAIRAANWTKALQLLKESAAPEGLRNLALLRDGLLAYTEGMSALDRGDADAAAKSEAALKVLVNPAKETHEAHAVPPAVHADKNDPRDAMHKPVTSYLELAHMELVASVEQAQKKDAEAAKDFAKALEFENKISYREPPLYIRPVEEAQGDALYRAGKYAESKAAYGIAQKKRRNSGFSLYGMARCDEAMKSATTAASYQTFLDAWKSADGNLPQVQHAQQWIMMHAMPANGM